jgi:hypothetical protein
MFFALVGVAAGFEFGYAASHDSAVGEDVSHGVAMFDGRGFMHPNDFHVRLS